MKLFLLLCVPSLLAHMITARAQATSNPLPDLASPNLRLDSVLSYLNSTITAADTGEGQRASRVAQFARVWRDRVVANDSAGTNLFGQYFRHSLQAASSARLAGICATGTYSGRWKNIGPDSLQSQNLGRLYSVWVGADTADLLVAGAGGVWKSADAGKNWTCLTDNTTVGKGIISPADISVNPQNPQQIYVGSKTYVHHVAVPQAIQWLGGYGNGLLYTPDGGVNWQQEILSFHTTPDWGDSIAEAKPYFTPDGSRVYGFRDSALFFKLAGGTWQALATDTIMGAGYVWWEMKFVPDGQGGRDPDHFFLVAHCRAGQAYLVEGVYNSTTQKHSFKNVSFPTSANVCGFYISIPTSNMLYLGNGHDLYRYNIATSAWNFVASLSIAAFGSGGFEAAMSNPARLYIPMDGLNAYMSNDTGHTEVDISTYGGVPTHGDVRGMYVHSIGNDGTGMGDRVYFATDGGVMMKPSGRNPLTVPTNHTCININGRGLACGQFLGLGSLEMDGTVLAGQHDNGFCTYEPWQSPPWFEMAGSDAGESVGSRTTPEAYGASSPDGTAAKLETFTAASSRILGNRSGYNTTTNTYNLKPSGEGHSAYVPLWGDPEGGIYAGLTHMWRKLPGQNVFARVSGNSIPQLGDAFDIDLPEYHPNNQSPNIKAMALSHYFSTATGYVLYEDGTLFYRGASSSFFLLADSNFLGGHPPTDITSDPSQPQKVWVSAGGINYDNPVKKRVMHSPDAGAHWFDISKGLPLHMPVTHVLHQEGSPYVYCSSDVGMYRLDMTPFAYTNINDSMSAFNSVQWTCFNAGAPSQHDFPMTYVSDLEINYCSGKLYASTYGRGIWETPLWSTGTYNPDPTIQITSNTTWSDSLYLTGSVRVKAGATLTINTPSGHSQTVIGLPSDGVIVVEKGARLVVEGARLTNGCKDCMWGGIRLIGPGTGNAQSAATAGTVEVKNTAVIEHARVAIANYHDTAMVPTTDRTGGIIKIWSGTFLNNATSVEMRPFEAAWTGSTAALDKSFIRGATFDLNNSYRGGALSLPFTQHVMLDHVWGIYLAADSFDNHITSIYGQGRGSGIYAMGGTFRVEAVCASGLSGVLCPTANMVRTRFSNLLYGIWVQGTNDHPATIAVDFARFNKTTIGVLLETVKTASVLRSEFTLGNAFLGYGPVNCDQNIGIAMRGTSLGFRIDENSFSYGSSAFRRYGVVADTTGPLGGKQVYKNSFSGLTYGVHTQGVNGSNAWVAPGTPNGTGIQVSCNAFSGNDSDFVAYGFYVPPPSTNPSYQPVVGWPLHWSHYYNTFPSSAGKIRYFGDYTWSPFYAHAGGNTLPASATGFYLQQITNSPVCPTRITSGTSGTIAASSRMSGSDVSAAQAGMMASLAGRVSAANALSSAIDGGNTDGLLSAIEAATEGTTDELISALTPHYPYLSEIVLRALVSKNVLTLESTMDVLRSNPDVLRNIGFLTFLQLDAPAPFPDEALTELLEYATTVSERGVAEDLLGRKTDSAFLCHTLLATDVAFDTTGERYDSTAAWLSRFPWASAQFAKAGHYARRGQYGSVESTYGAIPESFTLSAAQQRELNAYEAISAILKAGKDVGEGPGSLSSGLLSEMVLLTADSNGEAAWSARVIARLHGVGPVPRCFQAVAPTPRVLRRAQRTGQWPGGVQGNLVYVAPNPASSLMTFTYALPIRHGRVQVAIRDAAGRTARTLDMPGSSGVIPWDVREVTPGTYFYTVRDEKRELASGKVVVNR